MKQNEWLEKLKKTFVLKKEDSSKMELTPFRDWRVAILLFFMGLAVLVGFHVYMSVEINRDSFFTQTTEGGSTEALNKDGLSRVLEIFAKKEALFEKAKTEKIPVVDPSL